MNLKSTVFAGLLAAAVVTPAAPSFASPLLPQCGDEKGEEKKPKNPSAQPQCGDEKGEEKKPKNPSAQPQCGDEKEEKKPKNPSLL
jgi:hypothetical protein